MSEMENDSAAHEGAELVKIVEAYKREADNAKRSRMRQNANNWDFYHLKQDYSHKKPGQSREFLPKQMMAVEQITSFIHQGLVDMGEWFGVRAAPGNAKPFMSDDEVRKILADQLEKAGFLTVIADAVKSGLLGSLMIFKVGGTEVSRPKYVAKRSKGAVVGTDEKLVRYDKKQWQTKIEIIRPEDYYPDPTGKGLYELHEIEMDLHEVRALAEANPDIYDLEAVEALAADCSAQLEKERKERQTNQDEAMPKARPQVRIVEAWGTFVNAEGEVECENSVCAVANGRHLIRPAGPNPFWHQKSPFVVAPLIRVPWSVWHRALMDAPTMLNQAQNELYNLILDAGMMGVFGVRQVRRNWLENPDAVTDGIGPNTTLEVGPQCPPGAKALETVSTSALDQSALAVFNLTNAEHSASSLTNDLRMGVLPDRAVKATEVVEASQSITGVFTGVVKQIEISAIKPLLVQVWANTMQHVKDFNAPDYVSILGEARAKEVGKSSAKRRFAMTVDGHDFRVFGLTETLNKVKDFRKLTTLLQTVAQAPVLSEEFSRKYDFSKLLTEVMKALDIDADRIKLDQVDQLMGSMTAVEGEGASVAGRDAGAPDAMSQVAAPKGAPRPGVPQVELARANGEGPVQ